MRCKHICLNTSPRSKFICHWQPETSSISFPVCQYQNVARGAESVRSGWSVFPLNKCQMLKCKLLVVRGSSFFSPFRLLADVLSLCSGDNDGTRFGLVHAHMNTQRQTASGTFSQEVFRSLGMCFLYKPQWNEQGKSIIILFLEGPTLVNGNPR